MTGIVLIAFQVFDVDGNVVHGVMLTLPQLMQRTIGLQVGRCQGERWKRMVQIVVFCADGVRSCTIVMDVRGLVREAVA